MKAGEAVPIHSSPQGGDRRERSLGGHSCSGCRTARKAITVHHTIRFVTRSTAAAAGGLGTAASSVAAAALAASIILSPAADITSRLDGVQADLARAVQLNQITEEQATRFEAKMAARLLGNA
jgi:hypothetical protein